MFRVEQFALVSFLMEAHVYAVCTLYQVVIKGGKRDIEKQQNGEEKKERTNKKIEDEEKEKE